MIITVEGPTGAGKSEIAISLAQALGSQIISADSRQVYRAMNIGTAKVSKAQQAQIPHHLIDIIDANERYNAGRFVTAADAIIKSLHISCQTPVICGGTGLYIRSFVEGLFVHPPIPGEIKEQLRSLQAEHGLNYLYAELKQCDPALAERISANDTQRILRALEVYFATGKPLSAHWAQQKRQPRYRTFRILVLPPRQELYEKINLRFDKMIDAGLISEIELLLAAGYSWDSPGLSTMGYKEFQDYFTGTKSLQSCAELAAQHHRNYAKRQLTWYRKINFDLTLEPKCFSLSDVLGQPQPAYTADGT